MANVAFRLFRVDVSKNNSRTFVSPGQMLGKKTMQDLVLMMLSSMKGVILFERPKVNLDASIFLPLKPPNSGDPCFYVNDFKQIHGDVVEVEIYKGKYGDLDFLVSKSGSLSDISDDAATRKYLVRLAFPAGTNCCYLAAQMRGASQAGTDLFAYISYILHKAVMKKSGQYGITQIGDWYRFLPEPRADAQRFSDALGKAKVDSLRLVKNGVGRNGSRQQEKIVVEVSNLSVAVQKKGLGILGKLSKLAGHSSSYTPAINQIASLFPAWSSAKVTNWDDGTITFIENEKKTTISALAIAELFVYPLGNKASISDLWSEADLRLAKIGTADKIKIPSIV